MDEFNITTTATLRPELLQKTFQSFTNNLFKEDIKKAHLIINIDYAGIKDTDEIDVKLRQIMNVIDSFDFGSCKIRYGYKPHFPTAFCWCMAQIKYPLFFNLEEDWELLYEIDFERMVNLFSEYPNLAHLRLSSFLSTDRLKNWNRFLEWNGEFFEVTDNLTGTIGWCGHPSLNKSNFMLRCLPYIDPSSNPEKQIKGHHMVIARLIKQHRFGAFQKQNKPKSINDIGRQWMVDNMFKKAGSKAYFTNWENT